MAKDPAFLFYSKDWIEGTMEMTSQEKGVYIDLLAHQHQKGDLPCETKRLCKLVGLSESEFLPIWNDISFKFSPINGNRLVNKKLTEVVTERSKNGHVNKIVSALGVAVKKSDAPYEIKYQAKFGFKVADFIHIPDHEITDKVTEWFNKRLTERLTKPLANEDAIGNGNEDANYINNIGIVVEMAKIFKKHNSNIHIDKNAHYPACLQIAYRIAILKGWQKEEVLNGKMQETLKSWEIIVEFIKTDEWLSTRSLIDFNTQKEWDRLVSKMQLSRTPIKKKENELTSPIKKESEVDFEKYKKK